MKINLNLVQKILERRNRRRSLAAPIGETEEDEKKRSFELISRAKIKPTEASEFARAKVASLDLPYVVEFGEPTICNFIISADGSERAGEYHIPITYRDKDGTEVKNQFDIWLDSQTGKFREDEYYGITRQKVEDWMNFERQHFVAIAVRDKKQAQQLIEMVRNREGVLGFRAINCREARSGPALYGVLLGSNGYYRKEEVK